MKTSMTLALFVAASTAHEQRATAEWQEIIEIIDGFVLGALGTEQVYDLDLCIKDLNPLVMDMATAIAEFKTGSYPRIADGVYQLGQSLSQAGLVMKECPDAVREEDLDKLREMGDIFLHPKKLIMHSAKNLIVNGVEVFHGVKATFHDIKAQKYEAAGMDMGKATALILWGKPKMGHDPVDHAYMPSDGTAHILQ